jgi:hypothetical protein
VPSLKQPLTRSQPRIDCQGRLHSTLCARCAQHTSATLGELVRQAYAKNQHMSKAEAPLSRVVRQRALWTRLRTTFFVIGVDSDALSDVPALAQHERLAYPCSCHLQLPEEVDPSSPTFQPPVRAWSLTQCL